MRKPAKGTVEAVGLAYPDAVQGWFVPRYLVEGDDAPAAGLTSVSQLGEYAEVFQDPEDPDMGRFYNCIAGWVAKTPTPANCRPMGWMKPSPISVLAPAAHWLRPSILDPARTADCLLLLGPDLGHG